MQQSDVFKDIRAEFPDVFAFHVGAGRKKFIKRFNLKRGYTGDPSGYIFSAPVWDQCVLVIKNFKGVFECFACRFDAINVEEFVGCFPNDSVSNELDVEEGSDSVLRFRHPTTRKGVQMPFIDFETMSGRTSNQNQCLSTE
jgi:hypothetical protein